MSTHLTTKDQNTPNRSAQGGIIVLPIFTPKASSTCRPTLAETLRMAHPCFVERKYHSVISDMLCEAIFGHTVSVLRMILNVPAGGNLRRALMEHDCIRYHFLRTAEETLRMGVVRLIERKAGNVCLAEIDQQAGFVAIAFKSYREKVDVYVQPPELEECDTEF